MLAAKAVLERIALFLSHNTLIKHANESAEAGTEYLSIIELNGNDLYSVDGLNEHSKIK